MPAKALMILAEGFETIEALAPADILRRAGVELTIAGLDNQVIVSAHNVAVACDCLLTNAGDEYDAVILPGGMPGSVNLSESELVEQICQNMFKQGKIVAAICAAPAVALGKFGLLEGKKATGFPGTEQQFPSSARYIAETVVIDGNLVTSRGAGTALDFGYALTGILVDQSTAADLQSRMVYKV